MTEQASQWTPEENARIADTYQVTLMAPHVRALFVSPPYDPNCHEVVIQIKTTTGDIRGLRLHWHEGRQDVLAEHGIPDAPWFRVLALEWRVPDKWESLAPGFLELWEA